MSNITRQIVEPGRWEIEVAGGATFTLTRAQLVARILAETDPNRVAKALLRLRADVRTALGENFVPGRMRFRIKPDGTFVDVEHYASVANVLPDDEDAVRTVRQP